MTTSAYTEPAIYLSWNQRLAAFWSISWPGWVASLILVFGLTTGFAARSLARQAFALSVISNLVILMVQAPMVYRLLH